MGRVGEHDQLGVRGLRREDALGHVAVVHGPRQAVMCVGLTDLQQMRPIAQHNPVAAAHRQLAQQGILEEGQIHAVGQDQQVIPGALELLRDLHVAHGRSPVASSCAPSVVSGWLASCRSPQSPSSCRVMLSASKRESLNCRLL